MRVVIDTNTFISGVLWDGNESMIIDHCIDGTVENHTTLEIMGEVARVLGYPKFQLTDDEMNKLFMIYVGFSKVLSTSRKTKRVSRDKNDDMVLDCAIRSGSEYIISGDKDLLSLEEHKEIRIQRAKEMLSVLG